MARLGGVSDAASDHRRRVRACRCFRVRRRRRCGDRQRRERDGPPRRAQVLSDRAREGSTADRNDARRRQRDRRSRRGGRERPQGGTRDGPTGLADLEEAKLQNRTAAAHGVYTWINLATLSRATAGSQSDALLEQVVTTLKQDSAAEAIAMWKGADEPWWSGTAASALRFAFCRATGRGELSWCAGKPILDRDHLWVTIQAPRGTSGRPHAVLGRHRRPRRRHLSRDGGECEPRSCSGRQLDADDGFDHAGPFGVDDSPDLRERQRAPGRQLRPADAHPGAIHDLRRADQRSPQPRLLRRQQPRIAGTARQTTSTPGTGRSGTRR